MSKKIVIYGAGATARMMAEYLSEAIAGAVSDNLEHTFRLNGEIPVCDSSLLASKYPPEQFFVIVGVGYQHGTYRNGRCGMNARREELYLTLDSWGYQLASASNNDLCVNAGERVQPGTFFAPGVCMHHGASVGVNCFVSSNVTIGHDAHVGDHAWINAGVSIDGGAEVGDRCVIGSNAVIGAGVILGARTLVGPGAVVLRNTDPGATVLAAPSVTQRFDSEVFGSLI